MSVIISGVIPNPIAAAPRSQASAANAGPAPAATAPAATVEVSSGARQAATGHGDTDRHAPHPLNIIWGSGPK